MTRVQRIKEVLAGLTTIIGAFVLAHDIKMGYLFILAALSFTLISAGIRYLVYYFTMARHMVDGRWTLYTGALMLDFGLFTVALSMIPQVYVLIYLLVCHLFAGFVSVMRALEAKQYDSPTWKYSMALGGANIVMSIACGIFIKSFTAAVYIYCIGLLYSACVRIVTAFRKTAIVYIP